jgi:hypothetical protein
MTPQNPSERPATPAVERSGAQEGVDTAGPMRDAAAALDEWVEAMTTHEHTEPAP